MPHNLLDLSLLLQIIQRLARQTAIDLETIDERGDGDEAVGLDVFVEFVGGGFVEDDGVVGFVLDCRKRREESVGVGRVVMKIDVEGGALGGRWMIVPLPLDHFFFCFLPADAAAGACGFCQRVFVVSAC